MALIHACIPLVMDCGFQPFFAYAIIGHAIFFWIMFLNFYRQRYHSKEAVTAASDDESSSKQVVKSSVTSNLKMKPSSNGKSNSNGKQRHSPSPPPRSPQSQLMEAQKAALSHRRLASLTDSPSNSNNSNNSNNNNSRTANSSAKDR